MARGKALIAAAALAVGVYGVAKHVLGPPPNYDDKEQARFYLQHTANVFDSRLLKEVTVGCGGAVYAFADLDGRKRVKRIGSPEAGRATSADNLSLLGLVFGSSSLVSGVANVQGAAEGLSALEQGAVGGVVFVGAVGAVALARHEHAKESAARCTDVMQRVLEDTLEYESVIGMHEAGNLPAEHQRSTDSTSLAWQRTAAEQGMQDLLKVFSWKDDSLNRAEARRDNSTAMRTIKLVSECYQKLSVALRVKTLQGWITTGWYNIRPFATVVPNVRSVSDSVYFFAKSDSLTWNGEKSRTSLREPTFPWAFLDDGTAGTQNPFATERTFFPHRAILFAPRLYERNGLSLPSFKYSFPSNTSIVQGFKCEPRKRDR